MVDAGRAEEIEKRSLKRGTNDGLVDCIGVPEAPRRDMLQRSARRAPRPGRFLARNVRNRIAFIRVASRKTHPRD